MHFIAQTFNQISPIIFYSKRTVKPTLNKYIIFEILPTLLVSLPVFVIIIITTKMLTITEWIVTYRVHPIQIIKLILFLTPEIVLFVLPASVLMAVVFAFLRMSSDNEIIALQSSGIHLFQVLRPVIAISIISTVFGFFISILAVPSGNISFKNLTFEIIETKADLGIKERTFCEPFEDLIFYISSIDIEERVMRDVFVVDKRQESTVINTIVAKEGKILSDPHSLNVTVQFVDGSIIMTQRNLETVRSIKFSTYNLVVDLKKMLPSDLYEKKDPKEMSLGELFQNLEKVSQEEKKYNKILMVLMERFSVPVAVFLMGIIGAPLGSHIRARGRLIGITVSLLVFLAYYLFFAGVRSLCETGTIAPSFGMWIPNIFLLLACLYLLLRVGRRGVSKRPFGLLDALKQGITFKTITGLMKHVKTRNNDGNRQATLVDQKNDEEYPKANHYIGNMSARKFHDPNCRSAKMIQSNNRLCFSCKEEALEAGYLPCKICLK